ncbi:hypothetical protein IDM48_04515 [Rothia amarae]|uniref:Phage tail family protein n=1 Tax=Rothia amarae TaxID=169480 RepID=A0A7H2BLX5_9MICC|nr:hypothetical protein [Rothia amarae]QNV40671.1 hypothetical protein IDM48_04515 [Rothia amarae]
MVKAIRVATLSGAGLDLSFSNVEDESASYQAYLTDLAGFYGGVGVKDDGSQRTLGHGFFAVPSLRTGRELTLSGTLVFDTEQNRLLADRFLSGVLWDGEFGTLTVTTDDLTLTSTVKLGGEIKHSYLGMTALEVQIPLTAPDPFLYAPARVAQVFPAGFGQGLVYPLFTTKRNQDGVPVLDWGKSAPIASALPNEGNADAFPVITVRGDFPAGFSLTWNGRSITYPSTVAASTPVVVDSKTGSVLVGGMDQTYKLTSRDWFTVPAGSSFQPRITALAPSNGWADVSLSSTYM